MSVHFTKENVFANSFLLTKQNTITYAWTKHNDMDKISEGKDPTAFLLDTTTGCACWSGIRTIALQTGIKNVKHRYLVHFSKKGKDQISVIHTLCACLQGNYILHEILARFIDIMMTVYTRFYSTIHWQFSNNNTKFLPFSILLFLIQCHSSIVPINYYPQNN